MLGDYLAWIVDPVLQNPWRGHLLRFGLRCTDTVSGVRRFQRVPGQGMVCFGIKFENLAYRATSPGDF